MFDRFSNTQPSLAGPASSGFAVSPDDDDPIAEVSRALYVGTGGDLAVTLISGAGLTLRAVPDGSLLPLRVMRVHASGTTADDIVALV